VVFLCPVSEFLQEHHAKNLVVPHASILITGLQITCS
jgi:hypothetical protein